MAGRAPDSKTPRPVVKWAGGKTRLAERLVAMMPTRIGTYVEPFCGGAAVFFHLAGLPERRFERAVLGDMNPELVSLYKALKSDLKHLQEWLQDYARSHFEKQGDQEAQKKNYYRVRDQVTEKMSRAQRGARLIFLNKTCFNGLWRVNSKGRFNVPFGRYDKPRIVDVESLKAAHEALADVEIVESDFAAITKSLGQGDFVYFDPPYVPMSGTANFTAYAKGGFGAKDQERLRDEMLRLRSVGVKAMLSNTWSSDTEDLYRELTKYREPMARSINSDPSKRGEVDEMIALNYKLKARDEDAPERTAAPSAARKPKSRAKGPAPERVVPLNVKPKATARKAAS